MDTEQVLEFLGGLLKSLRKACNLEQHELEQKLRWSAGEVGKLESRKCPHVTIEMLVDYGKAFGIPPEEILRSVAAPLERRLQALSSAKKE